jgi:type I restriction enzyme S subunit
LGVAAVSEIRTDWPLTTIGAEFDIQQGKSLSPASRRGEKPRPFLRTSNVFWGQMDLMTVDQMDFTDEEFSRLSLEDGDLLVCEGGDIGRAAVYRGPSAQYAYQNHLHRLRAKTEGIVPEFVVHWLHAAFTQMGLYEGVGNKTTIPNLSRARLSQLPIPKPDPNEQRRLAAILNDLQRATDTESRAGGKLAALKSATVTKLFREGLRGEPRKQTEIGELPESWDVKPVSAVSDVVSGGTPSKRRADWWSGSIPWASPKDMKKLRLRDAEDHITPEAAEAGSRMVPVKTVFIVVRGMVLAKDVPMAIAEVPMAFNQDMKALLPSDAINPDFLLYALSARKSALIQEIGSSAHGTRRMSGSAVDGLLIPVPKDSHEQKEIAEALHTLDRREEVSKERVRSLKSLFSSTLHSLMTGAISIKDLDLAELTRA